MIHNDPECPSKAAAQHAEDALDQAPEQTVPARDAANLRQWNELDASRIAREVRIEDRLASRPPGPILPRTDGIFGLRVADSTDLGPPFPNSTLCTIFVLWPRSPKKPKLSTGKASKPELKPLDPYLADLLSPAVNRERGSGRGFCRAGAGNLHPRRRHRCRPGAGEEARPARGPMTGRTSADELGETSRSTSTACRPPSMR